MDMGEPISIILLESALELVPRELWKHPAVLKNARRRGKKPGKTLLDVSLHYHAMRKLKDREKRGRPDIVHISLLNALESPLNKEGYLRIYIHTYPGHIIFVKPETRIPRNYNRFVGLMEQLLIHGKVPPDSDDPLLYVKTMTISDLLEKINKNGIILLREQGEKEKPENIVKYAIENNYAIGIGGFPHGDYSEEIIDMSKAEFSIYNKPLTTWITVSRVIVGAENLFKII
ncbi:16S rRNA methyltransferase [Staphylothermus hellenicus]|uniref:Ribosomal RNA small subunit methyltransferase Nep1 n=1 Tax=Staphylothermus hellenicus (strain DSM 12710 / JCM 10830 / BK20S6-10-b1 / P8) TaxID=591019 RepID=D7D9N9_STAHD|nr:16S rRNA methyltransferase [Staphylothermus hellenicus]ADI32485.1 Suppressor Mra1 family protein [Staphylothermus hellenicus DSM 12710]